MPSADSAVELQALALRHLRSARSAVVLVGGLPGTGKSTLAAGLAAETGWVLLRSDEIRRASISGPGSLCARIPCRRIRGAARALPESGSRRESR